MKNEDLGQKKKGKDRAQKDEAELTGGKNLPEKDDKSMRTRDTFSGGPADQEDQEAPKKIRLPTSAVIGCWRVW